MKGEYVIEIKRQILKGFVIVISIFCSVSANANKIISTPVKGAVVVTQNGSQQRVCYYDDKAYSLGAVVEVSGVLIRCSAENDFETNGALGWIEIIKKDE
ncbi:YnjH family protein [Vibrio tasmaniensis]|uniref:YnjH family protein n=1 Tax=Vibrio tasmaniensis TaxID=212663 RepID=UPI0011188FBF|nr:YnjH family protein [Vibrio tasmaniensis]